MNIQRPTNVPGRHFVSWDRLSEYAAETGDVLDEQLGWGNEGIVYSTLSRRTAVKAYLHGSLYENERNVYARLLERNVTKVGRFDVPHIVACNDRLWVLEMSIVSPPFILDFAGAYLDKKPPFDDEQWAEWEQEKIEQFEDRWPEVSLAMSTFKRYGIHLNDIKPGNVEFAIE